MNVSTMLDITRSAPAPHLMRGRARLWPDTALFSFVIHSPEKASLIATTRDHNLSIHSPVGMTANIRASAFLMERPTGSRINFVSLCEDKILRDDQKPRGNTTSLDVTLYLKKQ